VRGVASGLACDAASRFASLIGIVALRTKAISTCLSVRLHRFERRGSLLRTSDARKRADGPYP